MHYPRQTTRGIVWKEQRKRRVELDYLNWRTVAFTSSAVELQCRAQTQALSVLTYGAVWPSGLPWSRSRRRARGCSGPWVSCGPAQRCPCPASRARSARAAAPSRTRPWRSSPCPCGKCTAREPPVTPGTSPASRGGAALPAAAWRAFLAGVSAGSASALPAPGKPAATPALSKGSGKLCSQGFGSPSKPPNKPKLPGTGTARVPCCRH